MSVQPGIDSPHLRRMRIEFEGLKSIGNLNFISNGTQDYLRISARINKRIAGLSAPTQIMLWNLDQGTRNSFQRDITKIKIYAGWDYGPRGSETLAFSGSIQNAQSNRFESDIVTTVFALPGGEAFAKDTFSHVWRQGTQIQTVVQTLAQNLTNVEVDPKNIVSIKGVVEEGGLSVDGKIYSIIDSLARQYSFNFCVLDDRFYAVDVNSAIATLGTLEPPYLTKLVPIMALPLKYERGIQWECMFDPNILPGFNVTIKDSIDGERYSGTYWVNQVDHDLDCFAPHSFITRGMSYIFSKR